MMSKRLLIILSFIAVVLVAGLAYHRLHKAPPPESRPGEPRAQTPTVVAPSIPVRPIIPAAPDARQPRRAEPIEALGKLNLSPAVRVAIGLDGDRKDYNAREKALRQLTRQLPAEDVKGLLLFLDLQTREQKDLDLRRFSAIKNDILDILSRQDQPPPGLGSQLVKMYRDTGHDNVWRDYCIQYLAGSYDATKATGVETNEPDMTRKEIEKAYWEALTEKDKTIAGTALLAVERLSRNHAEFDRKKVEEAALALATDERCGEASRITALRVCAMMNKAEALPSAKIVAQTGESVTLQMAAIATVGDLGGREDVELLKSMARSSEKRISNIASAAVTRLTQRLKAQGTEN